MSGGWAVIEMAQASGLPRLAPEERDPSVTSTYGTGQMISAALDAGCRHILVGIGGSATNDGGAGMACALGARLLDADGLPLPPGGGALSRLDVIDCSGLDKRLGEAEILVASDVTNPLCGPQGASAVYGPQKGGEPLRCWRCWMPRWPITDRSWRRLLAGILPACLGQALREGLAQG